MVFEFLFQYLLAIWIQVKGTNTYLLKTYSERAPVSTVEGIKINTISIPCPQGVYNLVGDMTEPKFPHLENTCHNRLN